jgi:hypothetical protein
MRRFFVEVTLDPNTEGSDNEDDTQLNTQTDDQPAHAEAMEITPDHPVYVEGKGWLWAENLAVEDRLRRADGGWAKVLAVEQVKLAEPELVYNFTVKGPHTYFVLEVGVLVHNVGPCRPGLETRTSEEFWRKGQLIDDEFEFFQQLARDRGKKVVLSGSLSETDLGLARRYTPETQQYLPPWRKPTSELVDKGKVRDVDFWEATDLTREEIASIQKRFPDAKEIDATGYSKSNYPNESSFTTQGGAIVFYPSGRTVRRSAPWQREDWFRQERWKKLRQQFGIPESSQMRGINDIQQWSGPPREQVWLGVANATHKFDAIGKPIAFDTHINMGNEERFKMADPAFAIFDSQYGRGGITGEAAADYFGSGQGALPLNERLEMMIDYATQTGRSANRPGQPGQIIFNLDSGISPQNTPRTWHELNYILQDPERLKRTIFVVDWYIYRK